MFLHTVNFNHGISKPAPSVPNGIHHVEKPS